MSEPTTLTQAVLVSGDPACHGPTGCVRPADVVSAADDVEGAVLSHLEDSTFSSSLDDADHIMSLPSGLAVHGVSVLFKQVAPPAVLVTASLVDGPPMAAAALTKALSHLAGGPAVLENQLTPSVTLWRLESEAAAVTLLSESPKLLRRKSTYRFERTSPATPGRPAPAPAPPAAAAPPAGADSSPPPAPTTPPRPKADSADSDGHTMSPPPTGASASTPLPKNIVVFHDGENCFISAKRRTDGSKLYDLVIKKALKTLVRARYANDPAMLASIDALHLAADVRVSWRLFLRLEEDPSKPGFPRNPNFRPHRTFMTSFRNRGVQHQQSGTKSDAVDTELRAALHEWLVDKEDSSRKSREETLIVLLGGDSDFSADVRQAVSRGFRTVVLYREGTANAGYLANATAIDGCWDQLVDMATGGRGSGSGARSAPGGSSDAPGPESMPVQSTATLRWLSKFRRWEMEKAAAAKNCAVKLDYVYKALEVKPLAGASASAPKEVLAGYANLVAMVRVHKVKIEEAFTQADVTFLQSPAFFQRCRQHLALAVVKTAEPEGLSRVTMLVPPGWTEDQAKARVSRLMTTPVPFGKVFMKPASKPTWKQTAIMHFKPSPAATRLVVKLVGLPATDVSFKVVKADQAVYTAALTTAGAGAGAGSGASGGGASRLSRVNMVTPLGWSEDQVRARLADLLPGTVSLETVKLTSPGDVQIATLVFKPSRQVTSAILQLVGQAATADGVSFKVVKADQAVYTALTTAGAGADAGAGGGADRLSRVNMVTPLGWSEDQVRARLTDLLPGRVSLKEVKLTSPYGVQIATCHFKPSRQVTSVILNLVGQAATADGVSFKVVKADQAVYTSLTASGGAGVGAGAGASAGAGGVAGTRAPPRSPPRRHHTSAAPELKTADVTIVYATDVGRDAVLELVEGRKQVCKTLLCPPAAALLIPAGGFRYLKKELGSHPEVRLRYHKTPRFRLELSGPVASVVAAEARLRDILHNVKEVKVVLPEPAPALIKRGLQTHLEQLVALDGGGGGGGGGQAGDADDGSVPPSFGGRLHLRWIRDPLRVSVVTFGEVGRLAELRASELAAFAADFVEEWWAQPPHSPALPPHEKLVEELGLTIFDPPAPSGGGAVGLTAAQPVVTAPPGVSRVNMVIPALWDDQRVRDELLGKFADLVALDSTTLRVGVAGMEQVATLTLSMAALPRQTTIQSLLDVTPYQLSTDPGHYIRFELTAEDVAAAAGSAPPEARYRLAGRRADVSMAIKTLDEIVAAKSASVAVSLRGLLPHGVPPQLLKSLLRLFPDHAKELQAAVRRHDTRFMLTSSSLVLRGSDSALPAAHASAMQALGVICAALRVELVPFSASEVDVVADGLGVELEPLKCAIVRSAVAAGHDVGTGAGAGAGAGSGSGNGGADDGPTSHPLLGSFKSARPEASATVGGITVTVLVGGWQACADGVDTLVNAANERLAHGGGIAASIADAAGPEFTAASSDSVRSLGTVGVGSARLTPAFQLASSLGIQRVAHAVAPMVGLPEPSELQHTMLKGAVLHAIRLAAEAGSHSVAIPCVGAGLFGWRAKDAASLIVRAVRQAAADPTIIRGITRVVLFDRSPSAVAAFVAAMEHSAAQTAGTVSTADTPAAVAVAPELPTHQWKYQRTAYEMSREPGPEWMPYDFDQNSLLEAAHEAGLVSVSLAGDRHGQIGQYSGARYVMDVPRMQQRNVATGYTRAARRDVLSPDDPPPPEFAKRLLAFQQATASPAVLAALVLAPVFGFQRCAATAAGLGSASGPPPAGGDGPLASGVLVVSLDTVALARGVQKVRQVFESKLQRCKPVSLTEISDDSVRGDLIQDMAAEVRDGNTTAKLEVSADQTEVTVAALRHVDLTTARHQVVEMVLLAREDQAVKQEAMKSMKYPQEWTWRPEDGDGPREVVLAPDSSEHRLVEEKFRRGGFTKPLVSVSRLENSVLWRRYFAKREVIAEECGGDANELWLVHGTGSTPPEMVWQSEHGVDARYTRDGCFFGKAAYMAEEAEYSDQGYVTYVDNGDGSQDALMFLTRTAAGKSEEREDARDSNLRHPAPGYHTVRGVVRQSGSRKFYAIMAYDTHMVYPAYMIRYRHNPV